MAGTALKRMSLDEFYAWDSHGDTNFELIGGAPTVMARPGGPHQALAGRLAGRLFQALDGHAPLLVRLRAGIVPTWRYATYSEADLAVSGAPVTSGCETKDPILIVEILSPSTENSDRKVKLRDYRRFPSVREIVLIDAYRVWCEVHRRQPDGRWIVDLLDEADARLVLDSVGLDVALLDLYANLSDLEAETRA
jgi:Uma2 family endonuclease